MKNTEKYLPLGSVVLLKGGEKKLMIIGYCPVQAGEEGATYDYSGSLWPEGLISSDQIALFNHDQIDKIFCLGLSNDEQKDFVTKLKDFMQNPNQN